MNLSYRRSCHRKQRHASKGAAEAHIRALARLGKDIAGLRPYLCVYCKANHVGHKPQSATRAA